VAGVGAAGVPAPDRVAAACDALEVHGHVEPVHHRDVVEVILDAGVDADGELPYYTARGPTRSRLTHILPFRPALLSLSSPTMQP